VFAGDRERLEPRFGVNWFVLPNPNLWILDQPYPTLGDKYGGLRIRVTSAGPAGRRDEGRRRARAHRKLEHQYLMTPETHRALANDFAPSRGGRWVATIARCRVRTHASRAEDRG
jgi:hypothetical protein